MEWCVGCPHSGEGVGQTVVLHEHYLNELGVDGKPHLVRFRSITVPICLLLAGLLKDGSHERQFPSGAELVPTYDHGHHEPTGYTPIGNDIDGSCTGRM